MIANETDKIDIYDSTLTMQGLRLIRNRCRDFKGHKDEFENWKY